MTLYIGIQGSLVYLAALPKTSADSVHMNRIYLSAALPPTLGQQPSAADELAGIKKTLTAAGVAFVAE